MSFLETGDAARAGIELGTFETEGGDPEIVAYWQKQIYGAPDSLFEADGTTHTVRSGESLSSISRLFLGDPLQFYLLARFNNIDNPSKIEAGQEILIPKPRTTPLEPQADTVTGPSPASETAAASAPRPETEPQGASPLETTAVEEEVTQEEVTQEEVTQEEVTQEEVTQEEVTQEEVTQEEVTQEEVTRASANGTSSETSSQPPLPTSPVDQTEIAAATDPQVREPRTTIRDLPDTPPEAFDVAAERAGQGELESAIVLLEDGLKRYPGNQKVRRAAVLAYAKHSEALLASGKPEQAAVTLAKAADLDPENTDIAARLQEVRNRLQAEAFYEKGLGLRDGGDAPSAMAAFSKALEIDPDFTEAQTQFESLQVEVVGQLQREAIEALRQEDYTAALDLWQRVLAIDPTNGTADRYQKHTLELLGREPPPESE